MNTEDRMNEIVEKRTLSTGDILVFPPTIERMIVVGKAEAHLVRDGAGAWADAQALVSAGAARELGGNDVQRITDSLRAVGLLMPGQVHDR